MKRAAEALAHLYVWAAITDILEGSSTPDRQDAMARKRVQRVIDIAKQEQARMLKIYDATLTQHPTDQETP